MTTQLNSLMALFQSAAHKLARQPELMKVNTYMMFHQHIVNLTCYFFFFFFFSSVYLDAHIKLVIPHHDYIYPLNQFEDLNILSGIVQKEKIKKYSPSDSLMVWSNLFKNIYIYMYFFRASILECGVPYLQPYD